jgi:hypothetical protein
MRRAITNLEKPTIQPPPKPKAPEDPDDEMETAEYEANFEVWKEEVKLVARRRMEQKTNYSLLFMSSFGDNVRRRRRN